MSIGKSDENKTERDEWDDGSIGNTRKKFSFMNIRISETHIPNNNEYIIEMQKYWNRMRHGPISSTFPISTSVFGLNQTIDGNKPVIVMNVVESIYAHQMRNKKLGEEKCDPFFNFTISISWIFDEVIWDEVIWDVALSKNFHFMINYSNSLINIFEYIVHVYCVCVILFIIVRHSFADRWQGR